VIKKLMLKTGYPNFFSLSYRRIEVSEIEAKTAIKAAHAMGLNFAGVDLIRSSRGPLVLEVNSSPGLEGIETSTKKDIAGMVIEYIENNYKDADTQNKTKGRG